MTRAILVDSELRELGLFLVVERSLVHRLISFSLWNGSTGFSTVDPGLCALGLSIVHPWFGVSRFLPFGVWHDSPWKSTTCS